MITMKLDGPIYSALLDDSAIAGQPYDDKQKAVIVAPDPL